MMRGSKVYLGEMICVKPNMLAKDLELVMKWTTNCYTKQCMMRFPEVYSGEMICVKPNTLSKYIELVMECTNERLSQAIHDEGLRGLFR
jgi:hypothetical protein